MTEKGPAWPFCSELCRNADLFNWLSEEHMISRELSEDEWMDLMQQRFEKLNPYDPDAF